MVFPGFSMVSHGFPVDSGATKAPIVVTPPVHPFGMVPQVTTCVCFDGICDV